MNWQTIAVIIALCIAAVIGVWLTLLVWRKRGVPGAVPFVILSAALTEWSFTYALEIGAKTLEAKIICAQFQYIGIAMIPVGWFLFAQGYLRYELWLRRRRIALLLIIPVLTILIGFTNQAHHLLWAAVELNTDGPLSVMDATYGVWWMVFFVYSYCLLLWGALVIFQGARNFSKAYQWQFLLLLFALLLPWLSNGLYLMRLSPIPQLDLGPFAFTISAVIMWHSIFRFQMFDLLPVTRSAVIERLNAAAFILDMKDRVVDVNQPARNTFAKDGSQLYGDSVSEVFSWWGELGEELATAIETQREIQLREDGIKRIYSLQITPIWNLEQKLTGRLLILRDTTAHHLAEEAMALAQVKTEFLAKVGHELRTPLTSLLGLTEMLEHGVYDPLTERQHQATRMLMTSTQHMIRLVNDLLQQARLERGSFQLEIVDFHIGDLLDRLIQNFEASAKVKGLHLVTEITPDVPAQLRGDPLRVYQILSNLVENAIKYTQKGQVSVHVFSPKETHYALQISDTGIGIPIEIQPLIFDPFQQAKVSKELEKGGFGLGLSIVKQLAMLMQGDVDVESEPGKGSTFTVTLPIEPSWEEQK